MAHMLTEYKKTVKKTAAGQLDMLDEKIGVRHARQSLQLY